MQIIVSARHFEVSPHLRRLVDEQFGRLPRFDPRVSRAEVTLNEEKNRCEVECLVSVERSGTVHAHAEAEDFRSAIDRNIDKLARQLRKAHSRRVEHKAVPPEREASEREAPEREAPEHGAPEREAPEHPAPEHGAPEHEAREHEARERPAVEGERTIAAGGA